LLKVLPAVKKTALLMENLVYFKKLVKEKRENIKAKRHKGNQKPFQIVIIFTK
jgi:hypothetical protein